MSVFGSSVSKQFSAIEPVMKSEHFPDALFDDNGRRQQFRFADHLVTLCGVELVESHAPLIHLFVVSSAPVFLTFLERKNSNLLIL